MARGRVKIVHRRACNILPLDSWGNDIVFYGHAYQSLQDIQSSCTLSLMDI